MPVEDDGYRQLTADTIRKGLEAELQAEFGFDIDLTESSVFSAITQSLAAVLANNQEQSLEGVYEAAFLETATGVHLDRVVSFVGIQRREAIHATGVQQFTAANPVTSNYVIRRGTIVQTASDDPIEFETTETTTISLFDDFESGDISPYSGDVGDATIVSTPDAYRGNKHLELAATSGAHIYRDDVDMQRGSTSHVHIRPNATGASGTVNIVTFLVDPDNPGDYYQIVADTVNSELRLESVVGGTVDNTLDTATGVTYDADAYHEIEFRPAITGNISVTLYGPNDNERASLAGQDFTHRGGVIGFKSGDANDTKHFDFYTQSAASANMRSRTGGERGNVGSNAISVLPSPPTGVESTTNLYATGADYLDTSGSNFVTGQDREDDEQLRERAQEAVTAGGAATADAIIGALVNDVNGVSSVTLYENKTDADNTDSGGLPPHSFEAVVYGGDDIDVAETIFDTKAVTARDYGGVHGTEVTENVVADTNGQEFSVSFTRPSEVDVDMTLDIVVDDTYIGDDALRDRIVQYIGGTLANGTEVEGLGVGDDVIIDRLQDIIVSDTGVVAMDEGVDSDPISTTPAASIVDGIEVVDIGDNEVAQANATDASITINKREQ